MPQNTLRNCIVSAFTAKTKSGAWSSPRIQFVQRNYRDISVSRTSWLQGESDELRRNARNRWSRKRS